MKAKNQKINIYARLEKILTLAGLILIAVGCIANLYGAFTNIRFIHDPIDFIYYFRYVILLGGGFAAGYLFAKKKSTQYSQLFMGVSYAVLAMTLCWVFDLARVSLENLIGYLSFPWGKMVFMGIPLLSVIASLIIAYFSQYKRSSRSDLSTFAKVGIILSFTVYQTYTLATGIYFLVAGTATYDPNTPVWLMVGGYLLTPLAIAIISYLLLNHINKQLDRLFYAAFIGAFYSILTFVLWEFRTDASYEATNVFSSIVTALTVFLTAILLWRARKAIK